LAAYKKALALDANNAGAHNGLGLILTDKGQLDAAIREFRRSLALDPNSVHTHTNLGNALAGKRDLDNAIREFRAAIAIDPRFAIPHTNLGIALFAKKQVPEAMAELEKALALEPNHTQGHAALGMALHQQGRFIEARTALRRARDLVSERDPLRLVIAEELRLCERLAGLDEKLSAVQSGQTEPVDAAERLALAEFCLLNRRRYAAAVRFYADAFASPPPAEKLRQHRYDAACSAALAAAGQGVDAGCLPDKLRGALRQQALAWMREDLATHQKMAEQSGPAARQIICKTLRHWQQDADLASVRDNAALDRLPDSEQNEWGQLWDAVAVLLKKVEENK
jgi:tetratricopeptide (TPR) repeat protein